MERGGTKAEDKGTLNSRFTRWFPPLLDALEWGMTMLPRLYQNEVFEESVKRNIVARIDTGGGKTLCAILLIKHTASQLHHLVATADQHKLIVFVVPAVSLVHQQGEIIKMQTGLRVKEYVGSMGSTASILRLEAITDQRDSQESIFGNGRSGWRSFTKRTSSWLRLRYGSTVSYTLIGLSQRSDLAR